MRMSQTVWLTRREGYAADPRLSREARAMLGILERHGGRTAEGCRLSDRQLAALVNEELRDPARADAILEHRRRRPKLPC